MLLLGETWLIMLSLPPNRMDSQAASLTLAMARRICLRVFKCVREYSVRVWRRVVRDTVDGDEFESLH